MEPTFGLDDLVLWVGVDNMAELGVSDIIIHKDPTRPDRDNIAHRIIEVRVMDGVYGFRTQGDNLPDPDGYWVEGEIHGLVIGVIYSTAPE